MTDYKPGTVAVATVSGIQDVRVFRTVDRGNETAWWRSATPVGGSYSHSDGQVANVRPLVVLDLDAARGCWADSSSPAAIVERLRETNSVAALAIADQIEAQTRPPKPAEPTGLGAVVEDAEGQRWVRVERPGGVTHWHDTRTPAGFPLRYEHIDAVRVLSEGVSA